jgi:hypothetical protein
MNDDLDIGCLQNPVLTIRPANLSAQHGFVKRRKSINALGVEENPCSRWSSHFLLQEFCRVVPKVPPNDELSSARTGWLVPRSRVSAMLAPAMSSAALS